MKEIYTEKYDELLSILFDEYGIEEKHLTIDGQIKLFELAEKMSH